MSEHSATTYLGMPWCGICEDAAPCVYTRLATLTAAAEQARAALTQVIVDISGFEAGSEWLEDTESFCAEALNALTAALAPTAPQGEEGAR